MACLTPHSQKEPFGFDRAEDSPGFMLWQATMSWQRAIKKALDPYQISHAQFVIGATLLWFEMRGQDSLQSHLIAWTKLDKMTVSKSLKKLESIHLVERQEDGKDTRAKLVCLTAKGRALIWRLIPIVEEVDSRFFNPLSSQEQKAVILGLQKCLP